MMRSARLTLALSFPLLAVLLAAPNASAEGAATAWDQKRVSEIAAELATSAGQLYRAVVKKQGGGQVGSGQANAYMRLKDNLRVARNETKHLARALADGKSREETEPAYRRLMTLVRDARVNARKMFLEKPILDEVDKANALLDQLEPYYLSAEPGSDAKPGANPEPARVPAASAEPAS